MARVEVMGWGFGEGYYRLSSGVLVLVTTSTTHTYSLVWSRSNPHYESGTEKMSLRIRRIMLQDSGLVLIERIEDCQSVV